MSTTKLAWVAVIAFIALVAGLIISNTRNLYEAIPANVNPDEVKTSFDQWHEFTAQDKAFHATFPTVPKTAEETIKDERSNQSVKYFLYISEIHNGNLFIIIRKVYPAVDKLPDIKNILEHYLADILSANPSNELIAAKEVRFKGHTAINFAFHHNQTYVEGNVFMVGKTLYSITYTSDLNNNNLGDYQYFMESFRLGPQ